MVQQRNNSAGYGNTTNFLEPRLHSKAPTLDVILAKKPDVPYNFEQF